MTKMPLVQAPKNLIEAANEQISAGKLLNKGGFVVTDYLNQALLETSMGVFYPVRRGIPVLIAREGFALTERAKSYQRTQGRS